jgi:hypothetical protein
VGELTDAIAADLEAIADLTRWAHTDGYTPTGAPLDRVIGTETTTTAVRHIDVDPDGEALTHSDDELVDDSPPDPDHVAAPRWDLGLGSHRSRAAYEASVPALRRADRFILVATLTTGLETPPAQRMGSGHELAVVTGAIEVMCRRLGALAPHEPSVRRPLGRARFEVDRGWRILDAAIHYGPADPDDQAVGDLCRVCRIRPQADRSGGRCHTCKRWRTRNGTERPRTLDQDAVDDAVEAQRRRRARGEGWGDEAFSAAQGAPIVSGRDAPEVVVERLDEVRLEAELIEAEAVWRKTLEPEKYLWVRAHRARLGRARRAS